MNAQVKMNVTSTLCVLILKDLMYVVVKRAFKAMEGIAQVTSSLEYFWSFDA